MRGRREILSTQASKEMVHGPTKMESRDKRGNGAVTHHGIDNPLLPRGADQQRQHRRHAGVVACIGVCQNGEGTT